MPGSAIRKAAVFLRGLPTTAAVQVIRRLPARQREAVVVEISGGPQAGDAEQQAASQEFAAAGRFVFLSGIGGASLATLVADEQPQTIAALAAQLPAVQAVELLRALPPAIEAEVVRRLAVFRPVPWVVLCDLERGLREKWGAPAAA